jgi:hypothetical protein
MPLLVDTDAFCKLGISGMLPEALSVLGTRTEDCGRLPALPRMLRRGRLTTIYGADACASLLPIAAAMSPVPKPDAAWVDKLRAVDRIDPGEALLFASAAQQGSLLLTGDKRALLALRNIDGFAAALKGRIVVMEGMLIALCDRLGPEAVRHRLGSLITTDITLKICFSADNSDPKAALHSYYRNVAAEVQPLILWDPGSGGVA